MLGDIRLDFQLPEKLRNNLGSFNIIVESVVEGFPLQQDGLEQEGERQIQYRVYLNKFNHPIGTLSAGHYMEEFYE